jgi:hypothetical protein
LITTTLLTPTPDGTLNDIVDGSEPHNHVSCALELLHRFFFEVVAFFV